MSKNCPIMKRMKENYESRSKIKLTRRTPAIIRIDGKAFHTWTKKEDLAVPFDAGFRGDMTDTAKYLCQNIQGAKMAYTQSDEISILITDYDKLNTMAWFDYDIQKMVSISASYATSKFNELRMVRNPMEAPFLTMAQFDSRVFNIPKEEVANYFLARQRDAVKNSISSLAQSLYSHKELHKKNSDEKQEMCFQKGHNWNDLPWYFKRGTIIVKNEYWNENLVQYKPDIKYTENLIQHKDSGHFSFNDGGDLDDPNVMPISLCNEGDIKIRTYWEEYETPLKIQESFFVNRDMI